MKYNFDKEKIKSLITEIIDMININYKFITHVPDMDSLVESFILNIKKINLSPETSITLFDVKTYGNADMRFRHELVCAFFVGVLGAKSKRNGIELVHRLPDNVVSGRIGNTNRYRGQINKYLSPDNFDITFQVNLKESIYNVLPEKFINNKLKSYKSKIDKKTSDENVKKEREIRKQKLVALLKRRLLSAFNYELRELVKFIPYDEGKDIMQDVFSEIFLQESCFK